MYTICMCIYKCHNLHPTGIYRHPNDKRKSTSHRNLNIFNTKSNTIDEWREHNKNSIAHCIWYVGTNDRVRCICSVFNYYSVIYLYVLYVLCASSEYIYLDMTKCHSNIVEMQPAVAHTIPPELVHKFNRNRFSVIYLLWCDIRCVAVCIVHCVIVYAIYALFVHLFIVYSHKLIEFTFNWKSYFSFSSSIDSFRIRVASHHHSLWHSHSYTLHMYCLCRYEIHSFSYWM